MLQLRVHLMQLKILHAATKTQCNPINIMCKNKKCNELLLPVISSSLTSVIFTTTLAGSPSALKKRKRQPDLAGAHTRLLDCEGSLPASPSRQARQVRDPHTVT